MYKLYPYYTLDGSVGLYSPDADDIFHSTYGAISESYEKFIQPVNFKNYFKNNIKIKILDICYGIGYNTKIFLKNYFENIYNETIHTNNILNNNDKIYTDNRYIEIIVDAVDNDKILTNLSPFFKINNKRINKQKFLFKNDRIEKIIKNNYYNDKYISKLSTIKVINIILLNSILDNIDEDTKHILHDKKYSQYFDNEIITYFKHIKNPTGIISHFTALNSFLHNIYYKYISTSHKMAVRYLKNTDFKFKLYNTDARQYIKTSDNRYNLIFLDAFTPDKCPCLWSYNFIEELYNHLEENGIVVTYTNSARVRNAFLSAGFFIYKIYSKSMNKYSGTLAIKSKFNNPKIDLLNLDIVHELSEYDLSLLKTKSGIFYRDKQLYLNNETILNNLNEEIKKCNLISVSKLKRQKIL